MKPQREIVAPGDNAAPDEIGFGDRAFERARKSEETPGNFRRALRRAWLGRCGRSRRRRQRLRLAEKPPGFVERIAKTSVDLHFMGV